MAAAIAAGAMICNGTTRVWRVASYDVHRDHGANGISVEGTGIECGAIETVLRWRTTVNGRVELTKSLARDRAAQLENPMCWMKSFVLDNSPAP
jgi:hypothetical protein